MQDAQIPSHPYDCLFPPQYPTCQTHTRYATSHHHRPLPSPDKPPLRSRRQSLSHRPRPHESVACGRHPHTRKSPAALLQHACSDAGKGHTAPACPVQRPRREYTHGPHSNPPPPRFIFSRRIYVRVRNQPRMLFPCPRVCGAPSACPFP